MQTRFFIAGLSALVLSISTAHATIQVSAPEISKVEVTGTQHRYRLAPHEFDSFKGRYSFDEGTHLRVWQQQNRFYAQIGNQAVQQMFATARGTFESANGATLRFSDDGSTVSVTQFGKLLIASSGADSGTRVAQK
jgi:hypothetical protein